MSILKVKDQTTGNWVAVPAIVGPKGDTGYPTDAQIATAVDDWLDDNVMQETGYVLDRTLTASDAAAPADLVGEIWDELIGLDELLGTGVV